MPYIKVKAFPKDEETKKIIAEGINKVFVNHWGCPPEAITISIEEFTPEDWNKTVKEGIIDSLTEGVMIREGVKQ